LCGASRVCVLKNEVTLKLGYYKAVWPNTKKDAAGHVTAFPMLRVTHGGTTRMVDYIGH